MSVYEVGPDVVWPDSLLVVRSWLTTNVPGMNVRTETNATFGTSTPDASMTLPLVLLSRIPGGSLDPDNVTEWADVDIDCYATTQGGVWALYQQVHAWMLRLIGKQTPFGVIDDVLVANGAGELNVTNPDLRRVVVTYRLATRAQSSI